MNGDLDPATFPLSQFRPRRQVRLPSTTVDRAAVPAIDVHNHLGRWLSTDGGWLAPDLGELLDIMDACNVARIVNLDGRWGSELDANLARYDRKYPDRFTTFCHVDLAVMAHEPKFEKYLVDQLRQNADQGARGLKVWKDLGLSFRDECGHLVLPDDERLAELFDVAGELALPVLIHTADPVAFFEPIDASNERIEDLAANPGWWFGRPGLPGFDELIDSLEAVVAAHPQTGFIGAHVGCAAEELGRVSDMLMRYPNYCVDVGGRMAELGRQPRAARQLVIDHPRQVLFGTDQYPVDDVEYRRWFRFLESADECFAYAPEDEPPTMGRWDVSALDLPDASLAAVYADNAKRVLGLSN